jgi:hypothetical protein
MVEIQVSQGAHGCMKPGIKKAAFQRLFEIIKD